MEDVQLIHSHGILAIERNKNMNRSGSRSHMALDP